VTEQLEIIAPSGAIEFLPLDATRGMTAIGRALSNDVRLADGVTADFAAVLDHRQQPWSLMALDGAANVRVNGQPLAEHASVNVKPWDSIEIGAYLLILADESANGSGGAAATAPPAAAVVPLAEVAEAGAQPAAAPIPPAPAEAASPYAPPHMATAATAATASTAAVAAPSVAASAASPVIAGLGQPIAPIRSELIVLALNEAAHTVDAGVPAMWELTVTNASSFVGDFEVHVSGYVLDKWISITPERFTMSVRESNRVVVTLHPDREPASLAGVHHFVIEVQSRSLHGAQRGHIVERASVAAQLIINPFHELSPSPVYPPETTLRYRERTAALSLPIYNGGNSHVQAVVSGREDGDDCRIEFPEALPAFAANGALATGGSGSASYGASGGSVASHTVIDGETTTRRGKRAVATYPDTQPVNLEPGQRAEVPILVSPRQRRFVGGKPSVYRIAITTTPPAGLQAAGVQPVVSQPRVIQETFVGRWIYMLLLLIVAILAVYFFRPRVSDVRFRYIDVNGEVQNTQMDDSGATEQASGFIAGLRSRLPDGGPDQPLTVRPDLSVRAGDAVTVSWTTRNGQDLVIYAGDDTAARVADVTERTVVRSGNEVLDTELAVSPEEGAQAVAANTGRVPRRFTLQVNNWISAVPLIGRIGSARKTFVIDVVPARAPAIESFGVSNEQVVFGTPEALTWLAQLPNQGDEVVIRERSNGNDVLLPPLPAVGTLVITPQVDTRYDLIVGSRVWITSTPVPQSLAVTVRMPTPDIRRLSVAPAQIVAGQPMTVSYDVQGSDEQVLVIDRGIATEEFVLNAAADSIAIPIQTPGAFSLRLRAFRFLPGSTDRDSQSAGSNQKAVAGTAATPTFTPSPTLPPTPTSTLSPTPTPIAPMIEVLALTPNEIVLGDTAEVLLTWQVIGDADQIQISAPDFDVTTADKKGQISVPRDKTRVFVMTVLYKGEAKASKSAELKVLEPTPTLTPEPPPPPTETPVPPPPTATAVPNPRVVSFGIESVPPATKSIDSNGVDVYNVDGGAEMVIKWDVFDATGADLIQRASTGNVPPITNRLPADQVTMLATSDSSFELQAYNNPTGANLTNPEPANSVGRTSRSIRVVLNDAREFDPPTNVNFTGGTTASEPLTITWSYNPEQTDGILGFRVFRAPIGSNDFVRIADETVLNNLARQYSDTEGPFCDRTYFVVAVYLDLTRPGADKTVETDAGSTSFLTPPCP
jgi:hypothetical protein